MAYQTNTGFISDLVTTTHGHLQDGANHVIHTGIIKALNVANAGSFIAHGMNIDSLSTGKFNISAGGFFRNGEYIEFSEATNATPPSSGATDWEGDSGYDWYGLICIDTSNNVVFRKPSGTLGAIKVADPTSGDIPLAVVQVLKDSDYAVTRKFQFLGIKKTSAALVAGDENSGSFRKRFEVETGGAIKTYNTTNAYWTKLGFVVPTANRTINFPNISGTVITHNDTGTVTSTMTNNTIQNALTFGIGNQNAVLVDDADAANNDYAKFTASGLEGRSYAEVKSDLGLTDFDNDDGGLVPSPASSGTTVKFLREDATWVIPTDTVYTHPSGDGNLHVIATSTSNNGKVLTAGSTAGSLSWTDKTVDTNTEYSIGDGGLTQKNFTTTLKNKLDGITAGAGVPRTDSEINTLAQAKVDALIDGAPGALNTLNEIAAAFNDDAAFNTTITNAIALKAPLASPTFTGTVVGISKAMVGLTDVDDLSAADIRAGTTAANVGLGDVSNITTAAMRAGVTAANVGLENVTNESKATMFANPTFTGEIGIGDVNVSETELGLLEGATSLGAGSLASLGITATAAEINILDGVASGLTAAEISILDGGLAAGDIPTLAKSKISTTGTWVTADIPNLATSKITSGTFADARIATAATWNAKQDALTFATGLADSSNTISLDFNSLTDLGTGTVIDNDYIPVYSASGTAYKQQKISWVKSLRLKLLVLVRFGLLCLLVPLLLEED